jgi:hypothetical protein
MIWLMVRLLLNKRPDIFSATIGLGLALSALYWENTPTDNGYNTICERHSGFYVWIACAGLLAVVALAELVTPVLRNKPSGGVP